DKYVAAEDDVELTQHGKTLLQVLNAELHPAPYILADTPAAIAVFIEVVFQVNVIHTAADRQLLIHPFLGSGQRAWGNIRCQNALASHQLARVTLFVFFYFHTQRVGFLTGRTSRRPDCQWPPLSSDFR